MKEETNLTSKKPERSQKEKLFNSEKQARELLRERPTQLIRQKKTRS